MTLPPREPSFRPVAVDLFAGAGGLSLGLEQAGFDVAAAVEYDPVHAATHLFNFPETATVCADLSRLESSELLAAVERGVALHDNRRWDGRIDLIAGGPPCQGFSFIGKRDVNDSRNGLVFAFLKMVEELNPRAVVMENVPGMASGGHAGILAEVVRTLRELGYSVPDPQIHNAAHYGAPQDRRRLFVLASADDVAAQIQHPTPKFSPPSKRPGMAQIKTPAGLPSGPTVLDALGDLPDLDKFAALALSDEVRLTKAQDAAASKKASLYARQMRGLDRADDDFSYPREHDQRLLTSSAQTEHIERSINRFKNTPQGETEPVSRFYRLHPAGLSNTLRAGTGSERGAYTSPRPIHPLLPRVISVREAARLHSFPDWFRLHATKWHGFRQVGNAVVPRVGQAIGEAVLAALGVTPAPATATVQLGATHLLNMTMRDATTFFDADPEFVPATRKRLAVTT